MISPYMDEPIDHLKTIQADERVNLSTNYVELFGLDELRRHQRGEKVGKPRKVKDQTKQRKKLFTPSQLEDMSYSNDPLPVIAARCGTSKETVRRYRNEARKLSD